MKRFLSLALAAVCLTCFIAPAFAAEAADIADYTVAGKLFKQLWAGSGFGGTLTLEIGANEGKSGRAVTTQKPMVFDLSYIYVRPAGQQPAEHRADLSLMDGDTAQTAAHFQFKEGVLALQADLIGTDWYVLEGAAAPADEADAASALTPLAQLKTVLLEQTGMPSIAGFVLPVLTTLQDQSDDLSDVLSAYTTRIDLWIEGYRQNAVLGKLADGTTTMEVQYAVSPAAIKAQLKQMVLDLLSDTATLSRLQALLDEDDAQKLLNPNLQSYYFSAIDALPLSGDLTISRTASLKGDTLALHLSMPMYDSQGGNVTLRYDRERGEGDLPDDNTISIESDTRAIALAYLEYSSMTDVTVLQGTFRSEPRGVGSFTVGQDGDTADSRQKTVAAAFTFKRQETESKDEEGREVYEYDATLSLAPDAAGGAEEELVQFTATDISLKARFASKELKAAATELDATLTIGGEEWAQAVTLTLNGRSRAKWEPETLPDERVSLGEMTKTELDALLPGVAARAGLLALQYLSLPMEDAAAPEVSSTPAAEASASPSQEPAATQEVFETPQP